MTIFNELKRRQVEESLKEGSSIEIGKLGQTIKDIREILGMTQTQMAKKLKMKQPALSRLEDNIERTSMKTVIKVANILNCIFKGSFVLKKPIKETIKERAEKVAEKMLKRTFSNMAMEEQAPSGITYNLQLKNLIAELMSNPGPELWED